MPSRCSFRNKASCQIESNAFLKSMNPTKRSCFWVMQYFSVSDLRMNRLSVVLHFFL